MTDAEVAAIAARAETATPGEWIVHEWTGEVLVYHQSGTQTTIAHYPATKADAVFIAHARADIPALLAERAALREIVRVVASERVILPVGDPAEDQCPFCYGEDPIARSERATVEHSLDGWFIHRPDCVVLKARAQVEGKQP